MSRVTIDLKKHARDHVHYDLSRHVVVGDEEGPYCYQLSHIRFRDIITGGRGVPRSNNTPHQSALKQKMHNSGTANSAGTTPAAGGEGRNLMDSPNPNHE